MAKSLKKGCVEAAMTSKSSESPSLNLGPHNKTDSRRKSLSLLHQYSETKASKPSNVRWLQVLGATCLLKTWCMSL